MREGAVVARWANGAATGAAFTNWMPAGEATGPEAGARPAVDTAQQAGGPAVSLPAAGPGTPASIWAGSQQSWLVVPVVRDIAQGATPEMASATTTHPAMKRDIGKREAIIGAVAPSWARL